MAFVHVQEYTENSLLLERLTILGSFCVAAMSQLSEPIETVAKVVVAEGVADTKFLLRCHANLKLVLCPGVCDNFPVVLTVHERSI